MINMDKRMIANIVYSIFMSGKLELVKADM